MALFQVESEGGPEWDDGFVTFRHETLAAIAGSSYERSSDPTIATAGSDGNGIDPGTVEDESTEDRSPG